jgi:hypothetical protein
MPAESTPIVLDDIFEAIDLCHLEEAKRFLKDLATLDETTGKKKVTVLAYATKKTATIARSITREETKPTPDLDDIKSNKERLQWAEEILSEIMNATAKAATKTSRAGAAEEPGEEDPALAAFMESSRMRMFKSKEFSEEQAAATEALKALQLSRADAHLANQQERRESHIQFVEGILSNASTTTPKP